MRPIAIVTPWFGADLTGGAEQQAFQVATRLAGRGHAVEVLTTCNGSFQSDWAVNHHAPGAGQEHGLTLRRFPVDARDSAAFDLVNAKLLALNSSSFRAGVNPITGEESRTFVQQNIRSAALLDYLRDEGEAYHAFIFLPYMFAPVMLGAPLVGDRAWLQPCLHDEAAAYLPQTAELFRGAHVLLFNSEGEMELALRLYGPGIHSRSVVVGEGIERARYEARQLTAALPPQLRAARFVLYLGRRDRTKNTDLLVRAFTQFKAAQPESDLQLVLAGPGIESFASADGVHDLGLVSEETKAALLAQCRALAQPSRHESFSRTMMEAWSEGRPVMAQRDCLATAFAVECSGGGWLAGTEVEWARLFARVAAAMDAELDELGLRGQAYAAVQADWDKVIGRYESLLEITPQTGEPSLTRHSLTSLGKGHPAPNAIDQIHVTPTRRRLDELHAIHQLLPDIAFGDAISNQARAIRAHLRQHGYQSEIFVKRRQARMKAEALLCDEVQPEPTDGLLYHHSIGSELTAFAVAHAGPKCLLYHNITPAEFFAPYRPGFAWMLETGRNHLPRLAPHFPVSTGDSAFNATELAACGFHAPGVLPIIVDPDRWNIEPDEQLMARLQDGRTNLLFVGRIAPNKQQDRLLEAFAYYCRLDPNSRLILAGEGRSSDPYFNHVLATSARLNLSAHVEITGQLEDAALLAYYRTAHLYWSPSAHEGFGAPLVEAMWFDVPVLALRATATPETMGAAGVLFEDDEEPAAVAARAYQLTHDTQLRQTVIAAQRTRRLDFAPAVVWSSLRELIARLTSATELAAMAKS